MKRKAVTVASAAFALMMMTMLVMVGNAVSTDARVIEHTYKVTIGPGSAHWTTFSTLSDDVYGSTTGTGYVDKFVMTVVGVGKIPVRIQVIDCCFMGDTIALGDRPSRYFSATSPNTIDIIHAFDPGTYTFYVGYIPPHTGSFPAGYDIIIDYWFP